MTNKSSINETALSPEEELKKLEEELSWELSKAAVDVAGIVDPTPISDTIGAVMSLSEGDYVGAGLSLLSMVPFVGDAVGKTSKGAKATRKISRIRARIIELMGKIEKKAPVDFTKRVDYLDGATGKFPNSSYKDKTRNPFAIQAELNEKVRRATTIDAATANAKIAEENARILEIHRRYLETGEWWYDGLDDLGDLRDPMLGGWYNQ